MKSISSSAYLLEIIFFDRLFVCLRIFYNTMQKFKEGPESPVSEQSICKPLRPSVKNRREGICSKTFSKGSRPSLIIFNVNIKLAFKKMLERMMELVILNNINKNLVK